jgi:hypothetical protein
MEEGLGIDVSAIWEGWRVRESWRTAHNGCGGAGQNEFQHGLRIVNSAIGLLNVMSVLECSVGSTGAFAAEACRSNAIGGVKEASQVTLITKPAPGGDLSQSALGVSELGAGRLEPKLPDVAANTISVMLAKTPGEMRGVHAGRTGDLRQTHRSSEIGAQEFLGAGEPLRRTSLRRSNPSGAFDQDLQHEGFDCQRREGFGVVEFARERGSEPGDFSTRMVCGLTENRSGLTQTRQP